MNVWFIEEKTPGDHSRVALRSHSGQYIGYNRLGGGFIEMSNTPIYFTPIISNSLDGRMRLCDLESYLGEEEELSVEFVVAPSEDNNTTTLSVNSITTTSGNVPTYTGNNPPNTGIVGMWLVAKLSGTIMLSPDKQPGEGSKVPLSAASGKLSLLLDPTMRDAPAYSAKWRIRRYNNTWPAILTQLYAKLELLHSAQTVSDVKSLVMVSYSGGGN